MPGGTNYRGYNQRSQLGNVNQAPADAAVIADRDSNHGSGEELEMNYALKSGSVHKTPRNSPFWRTTVPSTVIE